MAAPYKTVRIQNRRYLGNKYKLLPLITKVVREECERVHTVADIFAGTGAVASAFTDKKLITNDNLYSNYICHEAWFGGESYSEDKIIDLITAYNSRKVREDNYMSRNFADTYFSLEDCRKIGWIREDIEEKYRKGELTGRERALLITSLLYGMDKIANTCGHYDAYRQGAAFERHLELAVPKPEGDLNAHNVCYHMDANELAEHLEADLIYLDPPYNSRQYCDAYHLLENVARWDRPKVLGAAKKMDRTDLKSDYCTQRAKAALERLVDTVHGRYILLSYNNMAEKGNDRSNAKITDEEILRILRKKGTVKVFEEDYRAFSAGKSEIRGHKERLFLCTCRESGKAVIPSALNYTGGKYKLLPQLLPLFPEQIDQAVDLFCGGCNVGINLDCERVWFNDSNEALTGLLKTFQKLPKEEIFGWLFEQIKSYGLSLTCEYGYGYYGCESGAGLGAFNRAAYYRLRADFNRKTEKDAAYYLMLYLLIVYSFNNQIRFNKKGAFNLPVGKRDFNLRMQKKLGAFLDRLKNGDYQFMNQDFRQFSLDGFTKDSFFYVDPPYLITCAAYNEQTGWTEQDERDLLAFLEELHGRGIRFALSNVLESKGKKNRILEAWIGKNEQFRAIPLSYDYSNSNYHTRRDGVTREILVTNYRSDPAKEAEKGS
ncbi:MAG: Dam family site-specific DNA-(adenine-N6)-methyltransferase [Lachnospiraceae bacterium]|nr:Dam family site-specific DNA-(adenine-N6)-methyltransferase [Lachnospiraceae bacterium]